MVVPIVPIIYAGAAAVARYAAKWGVKKAAKKYGKTAVTNSMKGVRGAKQTVKKKPTEAGQGFDSYLGTAVRKTSKQTIKPTRAPKWKTGSKFSKTKPLNSKRQGSERSTDIKGARVPRKPRK